MHHIIRIGTCFFLPSLLVALPLSIVAEELTDSQKANILEELNTLEESAITSRESRIQTALVAVRRGAASDNDALDLYIKCIELVDFEEKNRRPSDFRDWRRDHAERLSNQGFRRALRHQLNWLAFCLELSNHSGDFSQAHSQRALQALDAIFNDSETLASHSHLLRENVFSSIFAQAYKIDKLQPDEIPTSPLPVAAVYEQVILPPYRHDRNYQGLRLAWRQRLLQERSIAENWSASGQQTQARYRSDPAQNSALREFLATEAPQLTWEMESDLFLHGDEINAVTTMLQHIKTHASHPNSKQWISSLRSMLDGEPLTTSESIPDSPSTDNLHNPEPFPNPTEETPPDNTAESRE